MCRKSLQAIDHVHSMARGSQVLALRLDRDRCTICMAMIAIGNVQYLVSESTEY